MRTADEGAANQPSENGSNYDVYLEPLWMGKVHLSNRLAQSRMHTTIEQNLGVYSTCIGNNNT
jgi:hypothetical protein